MKTLCKLLFILCMSFKISCLESQIDAYQSFIQPYADDWNEQSVQNLSTKDVATMSEILILSYDIAHSSVKMSQAKLLMQLELFNIITLSINDNFDTTMQAQNNNTSNMKAAIAELEKAQDQVKKSFSLLKNFGSLFVNINPQVTQKLILNLKAIILKWAKTQKDTINHIEHIKDDFITTANLFSNVETIFETIIKSDPINPSILLEGTNSVTDAYKKTEQTLKELTITRQSITADFNILFTLFFKHHYQHLYNRLQEDNGESFEMISIENGKLPDPEDFFIV